MADFEGSHRVPSCPRRLLQAIAVVQIPGAATVLERQAELPSLRVQLPIGKQAVEVSGLIELVGCELWGQGWRVGWVKCAFCWTFVNKW